MRIDTGGDGLIALVFGQLLATEYEIRGAERFVRRAEAVVGRHRCQQADEQLLPLLAALEAARNRTKLPNRELPEALFRDAKVVDRVAPKTGPKLGPTQLWPV